MGVILKKKFFDLGLVVKQREFVMDVQFGVGLEKVWIIYVGMVFWYGLFKLVSEFWSLRIRDSLSWKVLVYLRCGVDCYLGLCVVVLL